MTPADRPRLIASDLDGTLLRTDGTVSERTVAAVRGIQSAGLRFVLVTARPPRWLHGRDAGANGEDPYDLTRLLGSDGIALCANGALVYDGHRRAVVEERTLAADVVLDIVESVRAAVPGVAFALESRAGLAKEPHYVERIVDENGRTGELDAMLTPLPAKLLARAPHLDDLEFIAAVTDAVGTRAVVAYSGATGLAEISAAGVTKASVLADWAASWSIAADQVWAFGDMPNDLPLLTWAGRSFAVANAHPDVLAIATDRCGTNDEDGVAQVLETIS